ncbi:PP2C family protein-serine/threonine phosphatase [Rhizobium ruizarguesonis]|uniref:PP2C family protein-serine/threonine phosphatase n=1 Tax=Rhizobium ruizarguesonis TaxID=2081791 RepID=UPI0013DEC57C|nr:protein phosphatase 2C domain-containing protein [Rhizobium ruizarguesonis]NEJ98820.1 SpoIIE family protein phosphatase [Rhizobium ruizarguesonis]
MALIMDGRGAYARPAVFGSAIQGDRHEQQDAFRIEWLEEDRAWLMILADGMGGHAAGSVASALAVENFLATFKGSRKADEALHQTLLVALGAANASLGAWQRDKPETVGMGTTLVGAFMSVEGLSWVSVGDSPMWLYRDGEISRLNEDHSFREVAAASGAGNFGNVLQSALTGQSIPIVDCQPAPLLLQADDLILLGSDGMLTLDKSQIEATVYAAMTRNPELLTSLLLHAIEDQHKPRQDNCTLIVAAPDPPMPQVQVVRPARLSLVFLIVALGVTLACFGYILSGLI